jgi:primosomal protein N' (replication factor Y)
MRIAKVEPITTARGLRGPFDYLLPDGMDAEVGSLLVVPFARRKLLGVVTGLASESDLPPERLAQPLELLEASTTEELVELGGWIAERYVSPRSRGIALALPPGAGTGKRPRAAKARYERRSELTDAGRAALDGGGPVKPKLGDKQRAALAALADRGELSDRELAKLTGAGAPSITRLQERGLVVTRRAAVVRRPALTAVG